MEDVVLQRKKRKQLGETVAMDKQIHRMAKYNTRTLYKLPRTPTYERSDVNGINIGCRCQIKALET